MHTKTQDTSVNPCKTIFIPEERYLILKKKDVQKFLPVHTAMTLLDICRTINACRISEGRGELKGVVVEDDWPETPVIWSMIEARMTGGVDFVQWQAARITELEKQVKSLGGTP